MAGKNRMSDEYKESIPEMSDEELLTEISFIQFRDDRQCAGDPDICAEELMAEARKRMSERHEYRVMYNHIAEKYNEELHYFSPPQNKETELPADLVCPCGALKIWVRENGRIHYRLSVTKDS